MYIVYVHRLSDEGSPESGPNPHAELVWVPVFKTETVEAAWSWIAARKNPRWYKAEEFETYGLTSEDEAAGCLTAEEELAQIPTLEEYGEGE